MVLLLREIGEPSTQPTNARTDELVSGSIETMNQQFFFLTHGLADPDPGPFTWII